MKCKVTIKREKSSAFTFEGKVIAESTTHYKVVHDKQDSSSEGEWFPKNSKRAYTELAN